MDASTPPIKSSRKVSKASKKRFKDFFKESKVLHDQGEYEQALKVVEKAVALNGSSSKALLLAAKVNLELSRNKSAVQYLKRLLQIDSEYGNTEIDPKYQKGIIYILLGYAYQENAPKIAIQYYKSYLKKYPSGPQAEAASQMLKLIKDKR